MKLKLLPFLICAYASLAFERHENSDLRVSVTNLRNTKGSVLVSLFKDGDGYPDDPSRAVRKAKSEVAPDKTIAVNFTDLPPGNYAVAVLHDENNNLKMDKTWVGLPKEGYGFSNNARAPFGPPSFRQASFPHSNRETSVTIRIRY